MHQAPKKSCYWRYRIDGRLQFAEIFMATWKSNRSVSQPERQLCSKGLSENEEQHPRTTDYQACAFGGFRIKLSDS